LNEKILSCRRLSVTLKSKNLSAYPSVAFPCWLEDNHTVCVFRSSSA
jgi:hypothetical protein